MGIDSLAAVSTYILSETKDNYISDTYISSDLSILIDDIIEMDSISDEEKDQAILEMVDGDIEELQMLAQKVINQIFIVTNKYIKYAKEHNYCPSIIRDMEEDLEELKLIAEKVLNNANF